ncbi:MAG: UDP-N-acetylmuramoyl-tripeptide--D-alanyl-D-alanine ligase [Clostridiales bacterium]|nr:UDP-N-acetylmuramoyl-tripeptide--D-alanyl-D-alanine ligase [Clostridiales bacterium]
MSFLIIRYIHIFQLNSYKPQVQKKWVADNIPEFLLKTVWIFGTVPVILKLGDWGAAIGTAIYVLVALLNLPKKAKKPLVFTNRVKRLLVTQGIILAVIIALSIIMTDSRRFFTMVFAIVSICAPYFILFINWINSPMEKAINNRYIKDAKRIRSQMPELKVIGITGSYGKTSVKVFLGKLLSARYNVLVTPESYNTTLGVVRTLREKLRATHNVFVCEMGARNIGDIKEICDIVKPDYGVITSIGPQHLESFKSIENVVKTKFELVDSLGEDGVAFLNADNEYISGVSVPVKRVEFGTEKGDYRAMDIRVSERGSEFKIGDTQFKTKLIGRHNVLNIAAAVAVANTMGIPMEELVPLVYRLESVPHRLQLLGSGNRLVIDDAYNSNPEGAKAALEVLSAFDGFKLLVTPGMVELGTKQFECNYNFGVQASQVCDHVILIGERQTEPVYRGLIDSGYKKECITISKSLNDGLAAAERIDTGGKVRIMLLENDLPDNY